jgi:uncharacterized membrane protein YidH (DUF202 family)
MRAALGLLGHAVVLAPLWGFYLYFRDFVPGAGPQGGEAIFLLMVLYASVLLAIATWNAARLIWVQRRRAPGRAMLGGSAVIVATSLAVVLGVWLVQDMSLAPGGLGRLEVTLRLSLAVALFCGANLWASHAVHRERRSRRFLHGLP